MSVTVEIKDGSDTVGLILPKARTFRTGSRGFFGVTKAVISGKRYQVQLQLVEIGSKPEDENQSGSKVVAESGV